MNRTKIHTMDLCSAIEGYSFKFNPINLPPFFLAVQIVFISLIVLLIDLVVKQAINTV